MKRGTVVALGISLLIVGAGALVPVEVKVPPSKPSSRGVFLDLSAYSAGKLSKPVNLIFIHHSVGGQMLAEPGVDVPISESIHVSHPNGGGLRKLLESTGFRVHEASYKSKVGDKTDLFDWLPNFSSHMGTILRTKQNDELLADGATNQVVIFKSCYPNSEFEGEGSDPGVPTGPELTLANAKASFLQLRDRFAKEPKVLFVYLTAPPVAAHVPKQKLWRLAFRKLRGRPDLGEAMVRQASLARRFNEWVKSPAGWLQGYEHKNVAVLDYYDLLTGEGQSNLLLYPTENGTDSHPSSEGNRLAALRIAPDILRATRRAGIAE